MSSRDYKYFESDHIYFKIEKIRVKVKKNGGVYVCLRVHNSILTKLYTLEKSKKMNKLKLRRRIPYKTKFDDE